MTLRRGEEQSKRGRDRDRDGERDPQSNRESKIETRKSEERKREKAKRAKTVQSRFEPTHSYIFYVLFLSVSLPSSVCL